MKYVYYPGCSLKSSGKPYEQSLLEVFKKAELDVEELGGWNCCGATAYMSVDELKAFALAARNLALAEQVAFVASHMWLMKDIGAARGITLAQGGADK